jgi:hypothetical protein
MYSYTECRNYLQYAERRQGMNNTVNMEINRSQQNQSRDSSAMNVAAFFPRVWMIMIPLAVPYLIISFNYFLALERTGAIGAFIADMLMPVTNIAYVVLIFKLKSRKI